MFTLILIFMLNGQPRTVEMPVDSLQACLLGNAAQVTAQQFLHEHPGYTWDARWSCRVGVPGRDA